MRRTENGAATPVERLQEFVDTAVKVARVARKHRASLAGLNFYADKFAKLRTDSFVLFRELGDPSVGDISAVAEMMQLTFAPKTEFKKRFSVARELLHELQTHKWRGSRIDDVADSVFPLSLLAKTRRGYLISVGRQMNGCFDSGWYDACAVMMRRLIETAIIEAFEAKQLDGKIKTDQGEFLQLTALINAALAETAWNLSRNTKQALPQLRDIGHISAHSRRFTAQKSDVEKVQPQCRIAVEEFLHLAGLLDASA
jgi:Domain of unknown function (DUF4145)